jgi:cell division protein FtsW
VSLGLLRKIVEGRRSAPKAGARAGSRPGHAAASKPWLHERRPRSVSPVAEVRARRPSTSPSLLARASQVRLPAGLRLVLALRLPAALRARLPRTLRLRERATALQALGLRLAVRLRVALRRAQGAGRPIVAPVAQAPLVAGQAPTPELPERGIDLVLLLAVLGLLCIGTTIVYSSTAAGMPRAGGSLLSRQIVYVTLGGFAMWLAARLDYRRLRRMTYPLLVAALVLLFAALLFGARNGAHRWIGVGSLTFQPVELAKLALITYVAQSLARKADRVKTFTIGFVPHLVVCGAMMMLLLKQPDLGSSVVLGATTLAMLFVAGARVSYIVLAVLASAPIAYHLVVGTPWRMQRVLAYFNPEAYAHGEAYQFLQARLAIGSGGLGGVGLGRGNQSLGYLPEAHNDFIAAPIGEELGFLGIALVLVLFGVLLWRGLRAALGARDAFGSYLAFGITFLLGAQTLFNLGVVFGVIPNKGITLPLVSYGGTSLIVTMFLVGLLLNVARRPHWRSATRSLVNVPRKKRQRVRVVVA